MAYMYENRPTEKTYVYEWKPTKETCTYDSLVYVPCLIHIFAMAHSSVCRRQKKKFGHRRANVQLNRSRSLRTVVKMTKRNSTKVNLKFPLGKLKVSLTFFPGLFPPLLQQFGHVCAMTHAYVCHEICE